MGKLFYNMLGGTAGTNIATTHNGNYDFFSKVQPGYYWSATEFALVSNVAWSLSFYSGYQGFANEANGRFAWAVAPGNVGDAVLKNASVPEPGTLLLICAGLMGIVAQRGKIRDPGAVSVTGADPEWRSLRVPFSVAHKADEAVPRDSLGSAV